MTASELRERLSSCKIGEFFSVAREAIAYAEKLEAELAKRDEQIRELQWALAYLAEEVSATHWTTDELGEKILGTSTSIYEDGCPNLAAAIQHASAMLAKHQETKTDEYTGRT